MSDIELSGRVIARIDVKRLDRQTRKVTAKIFNCDNGERLYLAEYTTNQSEIASYYIAEKAVKEYCEQDDWIITNIDTNALLPSVKTVNKRTR